MQKRYPEQGKEVVAFRLSTVLVVSSVLPVQLSSCRIPSMLLGLKVQTHCDHLQYMRQH
jgi:hypothetical protein